MKVYVISWVGHDDEEYSTVRYNESIAYEVVARKNRMGMNAVSMIVEDVK